MTKEKFTQAKFHAEISEMNKKLEKKNQKIASLGKKIEGIEKFLESRVAAKKKCDNEKKQLEIENDLLQIKTLRTLCNKANIPMQELFKEVFAILLAKVSSKDEEDNETLKAETKIEEKLDDDSETEKQSASSDDIEQKEKDGKTDNSQNNENLHSYGNAKNGNLSEHDSVESPPKNDKGKSLNPVEKAKIEQKERLAQKQMPPPPKSQSVRNSSLEQKLSPYMGR